LTLGELVRDATRQLRRAALHYGHGTTNARDEAVFLVLRGLGLPFEAPSVRPVTPRELTRVRRLLQRRIRERVPVPYLINEAWLAGESFYVDRRVIVPRSHIAALLQERLRPWVHQPVRRVLDLCTGSGCLAVIAAKAFPRARVDAADLSAGALAVARRNLARNRLGRRVQLLRSDLFSRLGRRRYDLIVTNPPYVAAAAMRALPREYRHEPRLALAGGGDGLELVHRILRQARASLAPRGLLVCELGRGRTALERAFPRTPFAWPQEQVFVVSREQLPGA
jgi:ribosomal protein L3 glutamine methyltransferase